MLLYLNITLFQQKLLNEAILGNKAVQIVSPNCSFSFPCDTWHITRDRWGDMNLLSKFQLSSSYGLGVKTFSQRMTDSVTHLFNYKGVCKTAPHRLSKSEFFCAPKILWLKTLRRDMCKKYHTNIKTWSNCDKKHEIIAIFSCFGFISQKCAPILKHFVQSCDGMTATFF